MGRVKEGKGTLLGNAGEHFVCAELLRRDVIAAPAPRNAPGIDVLATNGPRSVNVRVKTMSDEADSWVWMARKSDGGIFRNLQDKLDFVVLVHIKGEGAPDYWVVPTAKLEEELNRHHNEWFAKPGRGGRAHNETRMRRYGQEPLHQEWLATYKDNWDLVIAELEARTRGR
jgi:hypothetical protein